MRTAAQGEQMIASGLEVFRLVEPGLAADQYLVAANDEPAGAGYRGGLEAGQFQGSRSGRFAPVPGCLLYRTLIDRGRANLEPEPGRC